MPLMNNLRLVHTYKLEFERVDSRKHIVSIALSCDGRYIALGYDNGYAEIRETFEPWSLFRTLKIGGSVRHIIWVAKPRPSLVLASSNGTINFVGLGTSVEEDTYVHSHVKAAIHSLVVNENGSQIAVAFGDKVGILDLDQLSNLKWMDSRSMLGLAKQDAMLIQYVPLSLHFIGPGILLVVYLDQAVAYSTKERGEYLWKVQGDGAWLASSAASPSGRQLVTLNLEQGIDIYSLMTKELIRAEPFRLTYGKKGPNQIFGVAFMDEDIVVTGHNHSRVVLLNINENASEIHRRPRYISLNNGDRRTRKVITGSIDGFPVIVALNGEGNESAVYIIRMAHQTVPRAVNCQPRSFDHQILWMLLFLSVLNTAFNVSSIIKGLELGSRTK